MEISYFEPITPTEKQPKHRVDLGGGSGGMKGVVARPGMGLGLGGGWFKKTASKGRVKI
jgi:hypothetical protein